MQKIGLYYWNRQPQVKLVDVRPIGDKYQIKDKNGNQVILDRQDAVVVQLALGVALRGGKTNV